MYDVIIVGSGPAGISAALTLKSLNRNFLLLGNKNLSQKIRKAEKINNYPALSSVSGEVFFALLSKQLVDMGIAVTEEMATGIYAMGKSFSVTTQTGIYEGKCVILATGVELVKSVAGEEEFLGKGVSYCATCDGSLYKGKNIAVVCTDKDKEHEVAFLASLAKKLYFVPLYKNPEVVGDNIEFVWGMPEKIEGERRVERLMFKGKTLDVDGVFFLKNATPASALVGGLQTKNGHVVADRNTATNLKGLFAAGDITGKPYQYAKAVGEGNVAAHAAYEYLSKLS